MALCIVTYGDPRGVGVSYERCSPVSGVVNPEAYFSRDFLMTEGLKGFATLHQVTCSVGAAGGA